MLITYFCSLIFWLRFLVFGVSFSTTSVRFAVVLVGEALFPPVIFVLVFDLFSALVAPEAYDIATDNG